ncbi:MAG: hypothetical protein RLZZ587_419 [Actinomycetota bacterium]
MRRTISFATVVLAAMTVISAPTAASASSGTVAPGATVSATAWEREITGFAYNGTVLPLPDGTFDEYVYRVHSGGSSVDVQGVAGYEGLTEAEQEAWYEEAGLAPYDFSWGAFFCLADTIADPTDGTQSDAGIVLNEMKYVSADVVLPNAGRQYMTDYVDDFYTPLNNGSIFDVDDFDSSLRTTVGYTTMSYGLMNFSASYADFSCTTDSSLVYGTVLNTADVADPQTERSFVVPSTLTVFTSDGDLIHVDSHGVYLGVTGQQNVVEFNAALWGMTRVDAELAATGPTDELALLATVGAAIVGVGVVLVRRRRS